MSIPEKKFVRPEERPVVGMLHMADTLFARIYHHVEVLAPCRVPRRGAAILICNHISSLDPALLQAACHQRLIHWMMAKEYMTVPGMAWFAKQIGIIPVDRNGRDSASLRAALRTLSNGGVLGIFPEGRISSTREMLPFQTGVALMAIKANVPIYPAYLDGSQRNQEMLQACLHRNEATVKFGPEIHFDRTDVTRSGLEKATQHLRDTVIGLAPLTTRNAARISPAA